MKKILVTGGAGFLGSHLCEKLLGQNNFVYCIDNLSTGSTNNISHLLTDKNFVFINHDINNFIDIKIDEIYNFACPASPLDYQKNPINTFTTNVLGALNLLNLAVKYNSKILQASTSEVYGDPEVHPQVEEYWGNVNPIGIRSCYDEGKRGAETLFFDFHRTYNLRIKVMRIFNTYGPRMQVDDGRVVSNFIVQALRQKDITIYGDGQQTRSFCYVDDLIDGTIKLMNSNDSILGPINIGNPIEFTIFELANIIINMTNSSSVLRNVKLPQDDPKKRKPNIEKANKLIEWTPKITLVEGLKKTVTFFKNIT